MLEKLPCEILMLIADWLPPASLRALSRASSKVYSILIPQIYRTIAYRADSEWALNVLDVGSFFLHLGHSRAADYLQHARHLQIQAPFHLVRFNRCAYYNIFRTVGLPASPNTLGASDEATAHEHFLDDVKVQLQLIFTHLKPNSLSTFEWRLGTCVPMGVLDQGGYLSRYQHRLTRLSLVTDGTCPHEWHHLEGISELSCLTAFEWEGIQHPTEADLLRQCIRHNWSHLDHLNIGFVPSAFAGALCWESLGLQQRELRVDDTIFEKPTAVPALSALSLSKVTLPPDLSSEGIAMFGALRALTLRDCPNQLPLLELLSQSRKSLQLEHFEISHDFLLHEPGDRSFSAIVRFLRSFRGLQHLNLRLSNFPASKSRIEDAIRHHRTTLKSLVYHERQPSPVDEDGLFEDDRDVSPVWIADLSTIVDLGRVTALALCARPSVARRCLRPTAKRSQIRLLHLRFSGPERIHRDIHREIVTFLHEKRRWYCRGSRLHCPVNPDAGCSSNDKSDYSHIPNAYFDRSPLEYIDLQEAVLESSVAIAEAEEIVSFAEWAFGPRGLPALRVLAFGDFSHGDRYTGQQFLLRRAYPAWEFASKSVAGDTSDDTMRLPFRPADMADPSIWDGVSVEGARFLSACPGGGLMESPYEL
ncbi:hypothetical protein DTO013E5_9197 [Penicillium roqueforti]|nr:hypothetical protein DTO012A1_8733 [Penicillium roqueforti]KAI2738930.1 hypothetical protein DTO013F2_9484 [Penicillium roqueforti]KAI2756341.1 hypothetical protein DTO006G1_7981 [Penicillium roqueforti]KAI2766389.1 hypothetical protein DTO012A8_8397 [Penicillium roqueforti]KAI3199926.1 hypothetical protein DTO013E5_9197 [Penicillium roqueforti]